MIASLVSQIFLLRKRTASWVLLGAWAVVSLLFAYALPYLALTTRTTIGHQGVLAQLALTTLLPQNMVSTLLIGFPFFGGVMVFILGVLVMGSEFSWGTLTPMFTQRASRQRIFFSKVLALAIALVPFVLVDFLLGFIASSLIAWREGQALGLPPLGDLPGALGAAWFILAAWASFGVMLSILWRGTTLPVGLGIVYGLVFEGVIAAFGSQVELLNQIAKAFLRTNGYSLISSLGTSAQGRALGPGSFVGPFVPGTQAFLFLAGYIVLFLAVSAVLVGRRDVT